MTGNSLALRPALVARLGAPMALFAGLAYSAFLLSPLTQPAGTRQVEFISELEVAGHPWSWLYRLADVGAGLAMVITAVAVRELLGRRPGTGTGSTFLAMAGIASVIDGATSMRCDVSSGGACAVAEHTAGGLLSELSVLHTDSGVAGLLARPPRPCCWAESWSRDRRCWPGCRSPSASRWRVPACSTWRCCCWEPMSVPPTSRTLLT